MEIKIDKDTGKVTATVAGKTEGAKKVSTATVTFEVEDALTLSKRMKEAAYLSNRLKKVNTWEKDRREKALAELGF